MSRFLAVPPDRLDADTLQALLEEYASRDGTDYGASERSLEGKVESLRAQLRDNSIRLVYDSETESWDLLPAQQADELLDS